MLTTWDLMPTLAETNPERLMRPLIQRGYCEVTAVRKIVPAASNCGPDRIVEVIFG